MKKYFPFEHGPLILETKTNTQMLRSITCLLFVLFFQLTSSATVVPFLKDSSTKKEKDLLHQPAFATPEKKVKPLEKLERKLAQKIIKKRLHQTDKYKAKSKKTLSTISLILGILGLALMFVPTLNILVLLVAPAAIITGFVARKDNEDKKSRLNALIGIIAGFVPFLIILILFAFFAIGGFSFAFE
jgi:hypothetical protein